MIRHKQITTKTDTATLTLAEMGTIIANKATAFTITIVAATGNIGLWYEIINIGAGKVTIVESGVGTITTLIQNETTLIICDGTSWHETNSAFEAGKVKISDDGNIITATEVEAALQENRALMNYADSPMIITGGDITEGTNAGTFKVAALTALLRITDSATGSLAYVTLAEQDNNAITAEDIPYFVSLNYNGGTPTISLSETNPYVADKRNIPIGRVMKEADNTVHFLNTGLRLQDGVQELHRRARTLREVELVSGSTISYSGTNNFEMTSGIAYSGINRRTISSYDSAATQFIAIYQDGSGGWTKALRNTIDYTHYDDGDGTLGNIGVGRYGCHWVYKHVDDEHVYVLYGRGSYKLAEAEIGLEPTKPDYLTDFGLLIGCIIAPQAGGSFTTILMVTDTVFVGTNIATHNNLGGLQGGATDEYYHLTEAEKNASHIRKHDIDGTDDHNGVGGAVEDNFISFNANGLPKDSGKSDASYEDAGAVATHAALTETHGVSGDIVGTSDTQTLTNKQIPAISAYAFFMA